MTIPAFLNKFQAIKQIPIFKNLSWFELNRIARRAIIVEYKKGDFICREGNPADAFYCLLSGRVQSFSGRGGIKENVEFIHRGMHFGIISALTGENHSHTFEAINDSIVVKIDKNDFSDILKSTPKLALILSQSLSQRIRRHTTQSTSNLESTIISVYAPIKGSGSSTYAINLAISLERETGKKVLFVHLNSVFGMSAAVSKESAPQWKGSGVDLQEIVGDYEKTLAAVSKEEMTIDLLHVDFDSGDASLVSKMSQFVSSLVNDYNYIIVDLPNEMDDVVLKTLTQSDIIQLITVDRDKDLEQTRLVIDRLEETLKENFRVDSLNIILSGVENKFHKKFEEVKEIVNFDIYAILPHVERSQLNVAVVTKGITIITTDPQSEYAQTITRISRKISGVLVGLVLGGGAALGLAHIGVLRVLERERIPVDMVVGSSMGALIGALWCSGMNCDELEVLAREFEKKFNMLKLCDPVIPIDALISGEAIRGWLRRTMGNKTFLDTKVPFRAIAYDLSRRQDLVIDSGSLVEAVRRSISIPGVIRPVIDGDQVIIDGGVLNPLPTNVLVDMGVKKIIAVNVLQSPQHVCDGYERVHNMLKIQAQIPFLKAPWKFVSFRIGRFFTRMFTPNISDIIVQTLQATEYVIATESAKNADIVIHPNLTGINWYELYKVGELIKLGEEATMQQLGPIKQMVKDSSGRKC